MEKEKISFEQFLTAVEPPYQDFIGGLHDYLLDNDCKAKIEQKSSGYFISYVYTKSKKSILNLLFRKKGLIARVYGENANKYPEFIQTLPDEMLKSIVKAPVCKRLVNPDACNPKCTTGYDFMVKDERFQKCKNSCFMFDVSDGSNPFIKSFVEHELKERVAV